MKLIDFIKSDMIPVWHIMSFLLIFVSSIVLAIFIHFYFFIYGMLLLLCIICVLSVYTTGSHGSGMCSGGEWI